ncbi:MAG: hypothetical protein B9S32_05325 [Verrucomicrobia bacterium Tous-C9LFEB]|nr:MAG: hypothetical protein B9S32_05325 [Verrucomicrobia bacterium Tous-C9LFEB]
MTTPAVSIIIPCYNQAHYLHKAVRSCLEQTLPDFEILVINDGSTDNFDEVFRAFDSPPQLRRHDQSNAGLACARNAGIQLARGRYLQFLDADDYLHPDKLRRQVQLLDENPAYAFTYCDITRVRDDSGTPIDHDSVGLYRQTLTGDILISLLIGGFFPPNAVLVRKEVIDRYGSFTPGLDGHADYELWLRLSAQRQSGFYLDQKLAYYRVHDGNMTGNTAHMHQTYLAALHKIAAEFPERLADGVAGLKAHIDCLTAANVALQHQINENDFQLAKTTQSHDQLQAELKKKDQQLAESKTTDPALVDQLIRENQKLKKLLQKMKD